MIERTAAFGQALFTRNIVPNAGMVLTIVHRGAKIMSTPAVTVDALTAALDTLYTDFSAVIRQLNLDAPIAAPGDWTPRQVLSHIIGSLHRTPVQAGYFLAGSQMVPVVFSDPYWLSAWETAPREAFDAILFTEVAGNKAYVQSLSPDALDCVAPVNGFGPMPLGAFLR